MQRLFLEKDVTDFTGLSRQDVKNYVRRRLLSTKLERPRWGKPKRYSIDNILDFAIVKKLSIVGVPMPQVGKFVKPMFAAKRYPNYLIWNGFDVVESETIPTDLPAVGAVCVREIVKQACKLTPRYTRRVI